MPDTVPNTATAPAAPPVTTSPEGQPSSTQSVSPSPAPPKSFKEALAGTMTDEGKEFGMDEHGRWTIEPLAKPEMIDGHSVEELERIAQGEQPQDQPAVPSPTTVQPLSQPPAQPPAQTQPTSEVAALQQQVALLTQYILSQQGQQGENGNGHTPATPPTPSMRDHLAKQLEEKGYEPELADVFVGAMDQREQQLRSQIATEFNLPQMQLQSDLMRLYQAHGEDFKAALPAIELVRRGDPTIPLEQAYEGVRLMRQALGITGAPQQAPTNGATATPSQPRVLTQQEAQALLAKRDLMKTQSGVNGTEARPSNVKKSFGEMLHDDLTNARRAGRAGG